VATFRVEKAKATGLPRRGRLSSNRPVHTSGAAVNVVAKADMLLGIPAENIRSYSFVFVRIRSYVFVCTVSTGGIVHVGAADGVS
jgi:hypothetical protein